MPTFRTYSHTAMALVVRNRPRLTSTSCTKPSIASAPIPVLAGHGRTCIRWFAVPHRSHTVFFLPWRGSTLVTRILRGAADHLKAFEGYDPPAGMAD